jgi:hypothetical protein
LNITCDSDAIDGDVENVHLKKLVGKMKTNLCNISVLSENDLELLSDMDPDSVVKTLKLNLH